MRKQIMWTGQGLQVMVAIAAIFFPYCSLWKFQGQVSDYCNEEQR